MNEHDLSADLSGIYRDRAVVAGRPVVHQRFGAIEFDDIPHRRGFLPPINAWRFQSMFSATKFVVAGAIVALFGGFLLAGVLTQQGDESAPVVGASASASSEVRSDLLPGVDLAIEEVGPSLVRVLGDGVRRTLGNIRDVAVAPNGDVWVMRQNGTVYRLAEPGNAFQQREVAFHLRNDGTFWVASRRLGGEDWVKDWADPCRARHLLPYGYLAPDGTCWTGPDAKIGRFHPLDESGAFLDPGSLDGYPEFGGGHISIGEDGTVWAGLRSESSFVGLAAYDGTTWKAVEFDGVIDAHVSGLGVGPDGTVWTAHYGGDGLVAASWDGETWATYELGPVGLGVVKRFSDRAVQFLPDGSPWFYGVAELDGESLRPIDVLASLGDGWPSVKALANTTDDSTWMVVERSGDDPRTGLYVITPEAIAATE